MFRVEQQTPCVLSLMRCFNGKKISKRHFEEALVVIENFHFLFTAVTSQRSSGGISEMYASLGRRLHEAPDTQSSVTLIGELKTKLRGRVPLLGEFKALFPSILFTDSRTKQKNLVRYILSRFHADLYPSTPIDFEQMTIEHLVPQSEIGTNTFDEDTVGQLGNLILVTSELNGKLANKPFKEKKKIIMESGSFLPSEFSALDVLTVADIRRRTDNLSETAFSRLWKV